MISEDSQSILNRVQALSFYTMEKRADTVGEHAVYSILRILLEGRKGNTKPLRIHFLGHSFGCKVVCSALQEIIDDKKTVDIPAHVQFRAVLLQAAFDNDDLDKNDIYGGIAKGLPSLRMLVTCSELDKALNSAYPKAETINFFKARNSRTALGAKGPTEKVTALFWGADNVTVATGFKEKDIAGLTKRLVVADLTPIHQANPKGDDKDSGHHSDIFLPEIYALIVGFLFG